MLRSRNTKRVAITMGDPSGVGPEVIASALRKLRQTKHEIVIIGDQDVLKHYWKGPDLPCSIHVKKNERIRHVPGVSTLASGEDSLLYLNKFVELYKAGEVDALVTGPVSKEAISRFIKDFKGHTTFLANAFKKKNVEMLFVADDVRMVLVTRHIPLKDVPSVVSSARVVSVTRSAHDFLKEHGGLKKIRVALCGLNPHAGEGGHIGREEIDHIIPALKKLKRAGMDIEGPFPADTLFERRNLKKFDLIVSMYHDQGLPVLKALYFDKLVNVTTGLPFIRTSPAHGTAFNIAGKGIADDGSMRAAIELAGRLL
jgi:4-hydroxythreonine-4-phosphate dehydrogenase